MLVKNALRSIKLFFFIAVWLSVSLPALLSQVPTSRSPSAPRNENGGAVAFEVVSIKPANPNGGPMGIYTYPGGKIFAGQSTLKMLIQGAFNVQSFQILRGPNWVDAESYDIMALPPASSESSHANPPSRNAPPNDEQRKMLQAMLIDRFQLKFHKDVKEGSVYVLTRSNKNLQMKEANERNGLPYLLSPIKQGGVVDGELVGNNISMALFAQRLSKYLEHPVIDRTGLSGSFDFHLPVSDPSNHDIAGGLIDCVSRLGLKLKGGKGPVETIVIDSAMKPTAN